MPGGDGTGPGGMGPMTGRAAGYCAGYGVPGYTNPVGGRGYRGWGGGFGRGRGWRNWYRATGLPGWGRAPVGLPAWGGPAAPYSAAYGPYGAYAPPAPEQELEMLRGQAEHLNEAVKEIGKRIEELEAQTSGQE